MTDENNKNNKSDQDSKNTAEFFGKVLGIIIALLILYFIRRTTMCFSASTSDNVYLRKHSQSWFYQCELR